MPTRRQIAYGDPSSGRAGEFLRREWAEEIIELTKSTYISKTHIFGPARAGNTRSQLIDHMMDKPVGRAPSPDPSSFHILLGRVEEAVNNAIGTLFDSYPYPVATFPAFPRDGGGNNISQEAYRIRESYDHGLGIPAGPSLYFEGTNPLALLQDLRRLIHSVDDGYGCNFSIRGIYTWPDRTPIKYSYTEGSLIHLLTFYGAPTSGPDGEPIFNNEADFNRWRTSSMAPRLVRDLDCPIPPAPGVEGDFGGVPDIDSDGIPDAEDPDSGDGSPLLDTEIEGTSTAADTGGDAPVVTDERPMGSDLENMVEETAPLCNDDPEELNALPTCVSDPGAPVQDWSTTSEVFLNPNNCEYYVPVDTGFECPGADELQDRIFSRVGRGTDALLDFIGIGGLDDDPNAPIKAQVLASYIRERGDVSYEYEKFPRQNLRALYKWPFYFVSALGFVESNGENTSTPSNNTSVIIPAKSLLENVSKLRRALKKLAIQQILAVGEARYTLAINGSNLQVDLSEEVKIVQAMKTALSGLMEGNNIILPNPANSIRGSRSQLSLPNEKTVADEILLSINRNYNVTSIFAKPVYSGFRRLNTSTVAPDSPLNNATMVFYLANLPQLIKKIDSPTGLTIEDLVETYHYPIINKVPLSGQDSNTINCDVPSAMLERAGDVALGALSEAAQSALQGLALGLQKYACMDDQQVIDRNQKVADSLSELRNILESQAKSTVMGSGLVSDITSIIEQLDGGALDQTQLFAAWEGLFNGLTACGIANLSLDTIQSVVSNDICGISPEKAIQTILKRVLKDAPTSLEDLWNLLDGQLRIAIEGQYQSAISQGLSDAGYTGGAPLPWEFAESLEDQREREILGTNFYNAEAFNVGRDQNGEEDPEGIAFLEGYNYDFSRYDGGTFSQTEEYSFWLGFILAATEIIQTGARLGDPIFERPPLLPQVNQRRVTETASSEALNEQFIDLIILNTPLNSLLDLLKEIPEAGQGIMAVLDSVSDLSECIVNGNLKDIFGENLDVIQNNLAAFSSGGDIDFCSLKPLTKPDISLMMRQDVNTLWSAIQDAIIDALISFFSALILRLTLGLLKIAVSGFQGGLCDAAGGIFNAAVEGNLPEQLRDTFDIRGGFEAAYCGEGVSSETVNGRLADLAARASGVSSSAAAEAVSGDPNLIDTLSSQLRPDQLLRLLEGDPTPGVLRTVLRTIQNRGGELAIRLNNAGAIRNFFRELGSNFPENFLQTLRNSVEFAVSDGTVETTCDIDGITENLANALREECGDLITEEQIQNQLDRYEQRAEGLLDQLSSALVSGLDGSSQGIFESAIEEQLPKDDPANLVIAEEVVSMMFDPLFLTYANDLMAPMNPRRDGGFINLVLSNVNAVPQRGQINNYRATVAFVASLAGPLAPLVVEDVADNFDDQFFGRGGPAQGIPTDPAAARLKPATVAEYLRQIFQNFTNSESPYPFAYNPDDIGYVLAFGRDNPAFNIQFNGNTGKVTLQFESSYLGIGDIVLRNAPDYNAALEDVNALARNVYLVSLQWFLDQASIPARSASTMGTAVVEAAAFSSGLPGLFTILSGPAFEEYNTMRLGMRDNIMSRLTSKIASNSVAFTYGNYLLTPLTTNQLRGIDSPPEGYQILGLPDGRISVVPPPKGGWLQVKDILLGTPDEEFCCGDDLEENLFDMEVIRRQVMQSYEASVDDPRLSYNPRVVPEPPYSRIMSRMNSAAIDGIVSTTIKTYIIEYFLKGLGTFTIYRTNEEVFGTLLAEYVSDKMRQGLRSQMPRPAAPSYPRGAPGEENKLYAYWYEFLEQACQVVSRRVKEGRLYVQSQELNGALQSLQSAISNYEYPQLADLARERIERGIPVTLRNFRQKRKIDFIKETETDAMVVFKYLILDEMNKLADRVNRIFPVGADSWISNYSDLVESFMFPKAAGAEMSVVRPTARGGVREQNIFDVSRYNVEQDRLNRILPSVSLDDLRVNQDIFTGGQFVIQCYLRPTPKAEYATILRSISPVFDAEGILGVGEFVGFMDGSGLGPLPMSEVFEDVKYGLRLVYVIPLDDVGNMTQVVNVMNATVDIQNRLFEHHTWTSTPGLGEYVTPLVYNAFTLEESYGLIDESLNDFVDAVGTTNYTSDIRNVSVFNWQLLWERLTNSGEFKLLFNYSLQIQNMLSMAAIYNIEAFLDSIGGNEDEWFSGPRPINNYYSWNQQSFIRLRKQLKKLFQEVYNAQDFTYREDRLGAAEARDVAETRAETDIDATTAGDLPPGFSNRIISSNIICPEPEDEPSDRRPPVDYSDEIREYAEEAGDAPELEGIEEGLAEGPASDLVEDSYREAPARSEAASAELISWAAEVGGYAADEDFQQLLADVNGALMGGAGLPKNINLDDLVAGAGGAWDRSLFEGLATGLDATLAEGFARVSSVAGAMTGEEVFDFVNANFHSITEQMAATELLTGLQSADISLPSDFMTTFFSP